MFYFGELGRNLRTCSQPGDVYQKVDDEAEFSFSQFDFETENGVLYRLDEHLHYTYSVYPGSKQVKSKIRMGFYEKPIYNYKLECDLDPERSLKTLSDMINKSGQMNAWKKMLDAFGKYAIAGLCVIIGVPIISNKGTFICTPAAFIVVAGLFVEPIMYGFEAVNQLENQVDSMRLPEWINDCIDAKVSIDIPKLDDQ